MYVIAINVLLAIWWSGKTEAKIAISGAIFILNLKFNVLWNN